MLRHDPYKLLICSLLAIAAILFHKIPCAHSEESVPREYVLKSSIILKFFEFVKWPEERRIHNSESQFVFCLVGDNPFGNLFWLAQQEGVFKGRLVVRNVSLNSDLNPCHMAYISKSGDGQLEDILRRTEDKPILFVGDTLGYAERGVGINFVVINNRIRFKINRKAVERRDIKISSELLHLAIIVN